MYTTRDGGSQAWAYIGSANLSESAWGTLVTDQQTKQLKLTCRNWECGVVVPVPEGSNGNGNGNGSGNDLAAIFQPTVPVPMEVPGREYEGRRPWHL